MTLARRQLLACAGAAWLALPARAQETTAALRSQAEAALAAGDMATAQRPLERAAGMAHEVDTELALVRLAMQDGRYREALALAAHTAGGHPDQPSAALLYAWLLAAGGRHLIGRRIHEQALQRFPGHPLLEAMRAAFDGAAVAPPPGALAPPYRLAPQAWGEVPPADARLACTGCCDGLQVFAPASALPVGSALWLRSARGPTVRAHIARADGGVAVLVPDRPLPGTPVAETDAPPGSPVAVVGAAPGASTAWPWLFSGFAARVPLGGAPRGSDVQAPGCVDGATVVDATGRVAGLLVGGPAAPRWVEATTLARSFGAATAPAPPASARLAVDALYEAALPAVVQVLAAP